MNFVKSMTLGEAIASIRATDDPSGEVTRGMSVNAARAFDMHDAVHILFNCGTSVAGEIHAHIWMAFGTTAKLAEMHAAVAQQQHRTVLSSIGHIRLLKVWFRTLPRIVWIVVRSLKMKKRVSIEALPSLMSQSIERIRREHGIPIP
jgi:hypothetical protein